MKKTIIAIGVVASLTVPMLAFAAADPLITNAANEMGTALKENTIAGIQTLLPMLAVLIGLVMIITVAVRLFKRGAK